MFKSACVGLLCVAKIGMNGPILPNAENVSIPRTKTNLRRKIDLLRPGLSNQLVNKIAAGLKNCTANENLVLSIIKIESDFVVHAKNRRSNDYGLMQVNGYHIKRLGLDAERLLRDVDYNMQQGCLILDWFLLKYPLTEAIGRYNCGTRVGCHKWKHVRRYTEKVFTHYEKLQKVDLNFKGRGNVQNSK